jgi:hypothetical protein
MSRAHPPRIYADWLPLLDRFREGDDSVLEALSGGSIDWTSGVAERWTAQISSALTSRLQALSHRLQRGLDRSRDMFSVSRSLIDARRALAPLRTLASLPCAPEEVRKHLNSELDRFIRQTQESLETSASALRNDHGQLLKAIRDNPLTAAIDGGAPAAESKTEESAPGRGRRVIL